MFTFSLAQAPANYYDGTAGLSGSALKTQLRTIITNGHTDNGYGGLWTGYQTTDRDYFYENDGTILDIYSENPTGADPYNFTITTNQCGGSGYVNEGDCYNREHIVPQSLFNEASPMKNDINFIRATDGKVNGMRSNFPFGTVGTPTYTSLNGSKLGNSVSAGYSGTVFEPINAFKGDVARMIFYFVTRYGAQLSTFQSGNMLGGAEFPGLQQWELNQLLVWHTADPVSPAEIARNNASYAYQGNRNPYIDNPSFVASVWGTPVIDNQAPTAPTNLVASNPTSNSITLNWTASTDNIGISAYDVYMNGLLKTTVTATTATISGLAPTTAYSFYVIARDTSNNPSPQSNTVSATTLAGVPGTGSCGTEDFSTIPAAANSYATQVWTSNGITYTSTDSRTDETINGRALIIRNGNMTTSSVTGGISSLTLTTQLKFSGTSNSLNVLVNDVLVGIIPYSATVATTTISNINVTGNFVLKIVQPITGNRVAIDDLSWSCAGNLGTANVTKDSSAFSIYPNPVKNHELFVKGENLSKTAKAEVYDLSGKLILKVDQPFKNSNKINLHGVSKGVYILKTDNSSSKFIVD
jgi:endonuclease I